MILDEADKQKGAFVVRNWQVVLMLAIQLTLAGIAYGRITQQIEDLNRRMAAMESEKFVTQEDFNFWRTDFRRALDRIESDILDRNVHELGGR